MGFLFGGGQKSIHTADKMITNFRVQSSAYGLPIPIIYGTNRLAGNLIWYGDFTAHAHTDTQETGGKGGGGGEVTHTTYTYTVSFIMALCEGPIKDILKVWKGKEKLDSWDYTKRKGNRPQTVWDYLETNHPDEALAYPGIAYAASNNFYLGESTTLPNLSFEVAGLKIVDGKDDANPAEIILDILTNAHFGAGFDANKIASLDSYYDYCLAMDFLISPAFIDQQAAQEILTHLAELTNSEIIWSEGKLKIIPYGDEEVTGNGKTWTPDLTPIYHLTADDFVVEDDDEDPIICRRNPVSDAYNQIEVEYLNRSKDYNVETVEAKDQVNIEKNGLRAHDPLRMHEITRGSVARRVAQLILQRRLYKRNEYEFKLGWPYCLLEPMDLVTLTDSKLGLDQQLVRITEIEEDEDYFLVKAEEVDLGVASAPTYETEIGQGPGVNENDPPGNVNTPVIFMPPLSLIVARPGVTAHQIWMAISGSNASWGGCHVWASFDDVTYQYIGTVKGKARHGKLRETLPASSVSPDTTNTLKVDLTESQGELTSGTQEDADNLRTLCYVDGEYLAYQTATLVGPNKYDLTYLVRGAYGSNMDEHLADSQFARLDEAIFKYVMNVLDFGKTVYLKFQSFNVYGKAVQDLDDLTPITYNIPNPVGNALGPLVGLNINNNPTMPNTKLDVSCLSGNILGDNGVLYSFNDIDLTIDAGTTGENGLDQGSLTANTWYYVYLIVSYAGYKIAGLLSASSSNPTLPLGFIGKRLVGVCRTDASGNLKGFNQNGGEYFYENAEQAYTGSEAQNWVDKNMAAYLPPISTRGWFTVEVDTGADSCDYGLRKNGSAATVGQIYGSLNANSYGQSSGWCHTDDNQVVELKIENNVDNWYLYCGGFYLNI